MPNNFVSGVDSYVALGALTYAFKNWSIPVDGGVKKFFAFGSNFQRTLPGGISAEITVEGAYDAGNMPLVIGNVYAVHLGFAVGVELLVNARLSNAKYSSEIAAGGEPGGQVSCTFASEGAFTVSFYIMSERSAAMGDLASPHTIEYEGKTYTIRPVLTEGVMLEVESKFYARALKAVAEQRDYLPEAAYLAELKVLAKKYEDGFYAFESPHAAEMLTTQKGIMVLLGSMMDVSEQEILPLILNRGPELNSILDVVMRSSFPKAKAPVAPTTPHRGKKRRR